VAGAVPKGSTELAPDPSGPNNVPGTPTPAPPTVHDQPPTTRAGKRSVLVSRHERDGAN
jgi:hypothetical protein